MRLTDKRPKKVVKKKLSVSQLPGSGLRRRGGAGFQYTLSTEATVQSWFRNHQGEFFHSKDVALACRVSPEHVTTAIAGLKRSGWKVWKSMGGNKTLWMVREQ